MKDEVLTEGHTPPQSHLLKHLTKSPKQLCSRVTDLPYKTFAEIPSPAITTSSDPYSIGNLYRTDQD